MNVSVKPVTFVFGLQIWEAGILREFKSVYRNIRRRFPDDDKFEAYSLLLIFIISKPKVLYFSSLSFLLCLH